MSKQVRQAITPTHVLGSTGTAEGDDLGYRALADLKSDLALNNVDNTSDATKNSAVATLTNKTIDLTNNTVTGTTAEFNTALSDGSFATLDGTETLTNKTITDPLGIEGDDITAAPRHSIRPSLLLDFANTKSLDPRITFSRASTGTYYDGRTVAKAEENLYTQSQFANSPASTNATLTINDTSAPDGTLTAASLVEDNQTDVHMLSRTLASGVMPVGSTFTASVFAKPNGRNFLNVSINASVSGRYAYATFDVSSGTVTDSNSGFFTDISTSISAAANGYYRCALTFTVQSFEARGFIIGISDTGTPSVDVSGRVSYAGDGTSGIYIWGAQLEQRDAVTAYTPTTTQPITNYIPVLQTAAAGEARFDHDPVTGESKGLLIEEQRTNLLQRSDEFDNAYWSKTDASIDSNAIVAPDGTLTGDEVKTTSTLSSISRSILLAGGSYSFSLYCKKGNTDFVLLRLRESGVGDVAMVRFNLNTGTVSSTTTGSGTITAVGNGWYRCNVTGTAVAGNHSCSIYPNNNSGQAVGEYIYIWGAQLEAGAFPTSYIKTTSAQATRNADSASMTGTNFSSWYRQDEGTVCVEAALSNGGRYFHFNEAGTSNQIDLTQSVSNANFFVYSGGATQASINISSAYFLSHKVAGAYKTNDIASCVDGGSVSTDTVALLPAPNVLRLNAYLSGPLGSGTIKKLAYYPLRLTNAELQALTEA